MNLPIVFCSDIIYLIKFVCILLRLFFKIIFNFRMEKLKMHQLLLRFLFESLSLLGQLLFLHPKHDHGRIQWRMCHFDLICVLFKKNLKVLNQILKIAYFALSLDVFLIYLFNYSLLWQMEGCQAPLLQLVQLYAFLLKDVIDC